MGQNVGMISNIAAHNGKSDMSKQWLVSFCCPGGTEQRLGDAEDVPWS
jgi:hypothetical protein